MNKNIVKQVLITAKSAKVELDKLTPHQKNQLEKTWDIEHAYYSSVLEGSKLDRKEFEKLGVLVP